MQQLMSKRIVTMLKRGCFSFCGCVAFTGRRRKVLLLCSQHEQMSSSHWIHFLHTENELRLVVSADSFILRPLSQTSPYSKVSDSSIKRMKNQLTQPPPTHTKIPTPELKARSAVLIHLVCRERVVNTWSRWTFRLSLGLNTDPLKSL